MNTSVRAPDRHETVGSSALNGIVVAVAIALYSLALLSGSMDQSLLPWVIITAVTCLFLALMPGRGKALGRGVLIAITLVLARPSLVADFVPYLVLVPATTLFISNRGLARNQWRVFGPFVALIGLAVLFPGFVGRSPDIVYLAQQAVCAMVIGLSLLSAVNSLSALRMGTRLVAVLLTWQAVGFALSLLAPDGPAHTLVMPVGSRLNWIYTITPLGAVAVNGPGFSSEVGLRLTGWLPEPGLLAALAAVLSLLAFALRLPERWSIAAVALLTIAFAQSYAGGAALAVGSAVHLIGSPRNVGARRARQMAGYVMILAATFAILLSGPLSLQAKATANAESVSDRIGTGDGWGVFAQILSAPFGTGAAAPNSEINLIQSTLTNGLILFILWASVYLILPIRLASGSLAIGAITAVAVTVIFAQPPFYEIWICLTCLSVAVGTAARIGPPKLPPKDLSNE